MRSSKSSKRSPAASEDGLAHLISIKEEPQYDGEYGIMTPNNIDVPLQDFEIKEEIKQETLADDALTVQTLVSEKEIRPRRTIRKKAVNEVQQNNNPNKRYNASGKIVTLNDVAQMSGKQLVQYFSEMSSNEIARNFAYTCCLMPKQCGTFFTSFGSEAKARNLIQAHLLQHVKDLVAESSGNSSVKFSLHTMTNPPEEGTLTKKRGRTREAKVVKAPAAHNDVNAKRKNDGSANETNVTKAIDTNKNDVLDMSLEIISLSDIKVENIDFGEENIAKEVNDLAMVHLNETAAENFNNKKKTSKKCTINKNDEWGFPPEKQPSCITSSLTENEHTVVECYDVEHNCNLINPCCTDHTYDIRHYNMDPNATDVDCLDTGIQYSERPLPKYSPKVIEEIGENQLSKLHFSLQPDENINPSKLIIPIITVPLYALPRNLSLLPNDPFEEECDDIELPHSLNSLKTTPKGVVPELKNDVDDNESLNQGVYEDENDGAEITLEEVQELQGFRGSWNKDQVVTLARYYLHQAKMAKCSNRPTELCCKICPNKTFTATATLLFHYRSHMGLKPFACKRCSARFTRRHSLNYHMLTHQNISRFKCKTCDREFRHPSHYKEHTRRHTGETPFHCTDCPFKFKTRNTFKRHMRTKHGKEVPNMHGNRASRIMSPTKINRAILSQKDIVDVQPKNSVMLGTVENRGILSSIVTNGGQYPLLYLNTQTPAITRNDCLDQNLTAIEVKKEPVDTFESSSTFQLKSQILGSPTAVNDVPLMSHARLIARRTPRILQPRSKSQCKLGS